MGQAVGLNYNRKRRVRYRLDVFDVQEPFADRLPRMYPTLLILPLLYALALAGMALILGLAALLVAFVTREGKNTRTGDATTHWRSIVHGLSLDAAIWSLSIACGFVGAGLFSVVLNVAIVIFVSISYSIDPQAGGDVDERLLVWGYCGLIFLAFVASSAVGASRLNRWRVPERD